MIRRALFLTVILFALASSAFCQGARLDGIATVNVFGVQHVVANATIRVCSAGSTGSPCSPLASIYSNIALSVPLANPFNADANGNYYFFASPTVAYDIQISGTGIATITQTNVTMACATGCPGLSTNNAFTGNNTHSGIETFNTNAIVANAGITSAGPNALNGGGTTAGSWTHAGLHTFNLGLTSSGPNTLNGGGVFSGTYSGNHTLTGTATFSGLANLNGGGALNGSFSGPTTLTGAANLNGGGALNGSFSGPTTLTGNVTATAGQNALNAWSFNSLIYVDGIHFPTLASALATVPVGGALVIDTFVEAFTVNPFASTANPVWVQFGAGIWTTTVPIVLTANQWLTGAGPQHSQIKAVAGFSSTTLGVITLGNGAENHSMFVRDIGIACNSIANCTALVFDGAQNPTGASNVVISNYRVDGARLQQTSAPTGAVDLHDMWTYSATGLATTGAGVNISQFSGNVIVENVIQATDHAFPAPAAFKVGGGSGRVTFISNGGEGITDQYLLTATGVVVTIIAAGQDASTPPAGVNTVHVGAGVSNYELINVVQGTSTGAALVDDGRGYTCTGGIPFLVVSGGSTKYDFGTCSTVGWIRTPATTTATADLIQLQAGFSGTSTAYKVLSDTGVTQFSVSLDGRPTYRGNQSGAFTQILASDTLTASRTVQSPNGPSSTTMVAALVTTAAATDNVTIQGMTASGHCLLTPTNAAASGAASVPYVSTKAANQITVTHAVTANMNYDVMCTSN